MESSGLLSMRKIKAVLVSITPYNHPEIFHLKLQSIEYLSVAVDISMYNTIIFTSKRAVESVVRMGIELDGVDVVCVGESTRDCALREGACVLECVSGYSHQLYKRIKESYADRRFLFVRAEVVALDLAAQLRSDGIDISEVITYRTVCNKRAQSVAIDKDVVLIFTSASAVECFKKQYGFYNDNKIVVIGETAAKALDSDQVYHVAPKPTIESCTKMALRL